MSGLTCSGELIAAFFHEVLNRDVRSNCFGLVSPVKNSYQNSVVCDFRKPGFVYRLWFLRWRVLLLYRPLSLRRDLTSVSAAKLTWKLGSKGFALSTASLLTAYCLPLFSMKGLLRLFVLIGVACSCQRDHFRGPT